ncbi:unnamed protein product [Arabis nemorensis]|uniref:CCHC-type domain-containing protein n=1 Tax=Arabis nemorensis TaxID=586526 RepID=A0A565BSQ3_9BRAS|nr:unnamed protein product [Arabis nemorensis]
MELYLLSEDLWDVVGGSSTTPLRGAAATTAEATKEWTRKNAKAEFTLKRSISSGLLENELANAKQGESSISEFFIKVYELDYTPFVTLVQGWPTQPSLEEFENLLASQESLVIQMAGVKVHDDSESAIIARGQQSFKAKPKDGGLKNNDRREGSSTGYKRRLKCYQCGKLGHFKKA